MGAVLAERGWTRAAVVGHLPPHGRRTFSLFRVRAIRSCNVEFGGTMNAKMLASTAALATALTIGVVPAASAAKERVYTFGGYTFGGFVGINTDELAAALKDQAGARVTQADLALDIAAFTAELKARHVKGRLLGSFAEKHGTIWVIFDLQSSAPGATLYAGKPLRSQSFEGATRLPAGALAAATGLKPGDVLSVEKIRAAHDAILALYAHSAPGKAPTLRTRAQASGDGQVTLTWLLTEQ
jgi:hypothetical protein